MNQHEPPLHVAEGFLDMIVETACGITFVSSKQNTQKFRQI